MLGRDLEKQMAETLSRYNELQLKFAIMEENQKKIEEIQTKILKKLKIKKQVKALKNFLRSEKMFDSLTGLDNSKIKKIFSGCKEDNEKILHEFLKSSPEVINLSDNYGLTLLHHLIMIGQMDLAESLIQERQFKKINYSCCIPINRVQFIASALEWALAFWLGHSHHIQLDFIEKLLKRGIKLESKKPFYDFNLEGDVFTIITSQIWDDFYPQRREITEEQWPTYVFSKDVGNIISENDLEKSNIISPALIFVGTTTEKTGYILRKDEITNKDLLVCFLKNERMSLEEWEDLEKNSVNFKKQEIMRKLNSFRWFDSIYTETHSYNTFRSVEEIQELFSLLYRYGYSIETQLQDQEKINSFVSSNQISIPRALPEKDQISYNEFNTNLENKLRQSINAFINNLKNALEGQERITIPVLSELEKDRGEKTWDLPPGAIKTCSIM